MNIFSKYLEIAALSAIVFATTAFATPSAREVQVYEGDYPDESEQDFLQDSDQWRGTAWLKCIEYNEDWQGTDLDHFGNEHSTVRLTDCEFGLCYDSEPTPVMVAVELVDDAESQKPALVARDLRQGTYTFEKIKGDGTLVAWTTDPWSSAAIVIKNYEQFVGSIEAECAVVFGEVEDPERSGTGRIVIPENKTVTIAEGKHFSTQELQIDGTLIVNGALMDVGMVYGSGTVVLPAEIENGTNIGTYGCEESTIRFSNDFTGTFSDGCRISGNLDLGGNVITLTGGDNTEPYVINCLVGTGILNIEEASQSIEIREVLDLYTWEIAYKGRIIGATDKVTLPEDFTLDSRGYIVYGGAGHHYVTVPKNEAGVFKPVVMNQTAGEELVDVEDENYEFYVYRVPDGDSITVDITTPFSNVVVTSETHWAAVVNEDIAIPLPTGSTRGLKKLETRGPYIHEVRYDENWVSPADGALSDALPMSAVCVGSAVRNGNFVGCNLDSFVNDAPVFAVNMSRVEGVRCASVGFASPKLHEADVTGGAYSVEYSLPPLATFDGINENGVVIVANVVPLDVSGDMEEGTNPGKPDLHVVYVPRYVLDHATSAVHAIELLQKRNIVGDLLGQCGLHFLISDKDESYVVEFIDNELVWRKMDISTNFNLCWNNETKTKITDAIGGAWTKDDYPAPYAEETTLAAIETFYTDAAHGVERFITLCNHYADGATFEGMTNLLKRVKYSQAYSPKTAEESVSGPSWWVSESCAGDFPFPAYTKDDGTVITVERRLPQLYELFKTDCEYFSNFIDENDMAFGRQVLGDIEAYRSEPTGILHTTHNAIYDIAEHSVRLYLQENYDVPYDFVVEPYEPTTVTLDAQGGVGGDETVTATYGKAMPAAAMPTKENYDFLGYFDAQTGGTQYYNADGTSARAWDKDSPTTLYAQWQLRACIVTLDPNGGKGGTASVSVARGDVMPGPIDIPTRTDCEFLGYFDELTDGKQYYAADGTSGEVWDKSSAATLYAHWKDTRIVYDVDVEGESMSKPIRIRQTWLETHLQGVDVKNHAAVKAALVEVDPETGLKKWHEYVLGVEPGDTSAKIWIDSPQQASADRIKVKTREFTPTEDCGFTVKYRLDTELKGQAKTLGALVNSPDFDVDVTQGDPTGLYTVNVVFVPDGAENSDEVVKSVNTMGILKVPSPKTLEIVAVPWNRLAPEEDQPVLVADLVKTATLMAGDKLHVYDKAKKTYKSWSYDIEKSWVALSTFKVTAADLEQTLAPDPAEQTLVRGSAVWLERQDASKPFYLYGQYSKNEIETKIEKDKHNLVACPKMTAFRLNDAGRFGDAIDANDQIIVPQGGNTPPKIYTYKAGQGWGYSKFVSGRFKFDTTDDEVPVGTGFWYISRGGSPTIRW